MKLFRSIGKKTEEGKNAAVCPDDVPMGNGYTVDPMTGRLAFSPGMSVNLPPVFLRQGTRVGPGKSGCRYRVFRYSCRGADRWIYSYDYAPEGNWTSLESFDGAERWRGGETELEADGYYRFVIRGGECFDRLEEALAFRKPAAEYPEKRWIGEEAQRLCSRFRAAELPEGLCLFLLSDTHYAAGCNWADTRESLRRTAEFLPPEAVIHLGDLTDGMYSLAQTKYFASRVMRDLEGLGRPVFLCIGNHDENYFRGNPAVMNKKESARFYLDRESAFYYRDLPDHGLRMIFLDSFDPGAKERYGFSSAEVRWFRRALTGTPQGWRVLVFSHVPPLPEIHVWSDTIRHGTAMLEAVQRFDRQRGKAVLGWIHGHNHADQVFRGAEIPIIGIGCSKLEYFLEHKPDGSVTYPRRREDASQELWDVLFIPDGERQLHLFRYGAGEDRHITRGTE